MDFHVPQGYPGPGGGDFLNRRVPLHFGLGKLGILESHEGQLGTPHGWLGNSHNFMVIRTFGSKFGEILEIHKGPLGPPCGFWGQRANFPLFEQKGENFARWPQNH